MNSSCSPFSAEHALSQFAPLFLHFMLSCTLFSQHSSCFYLSLSIFSIHDPLQILSLCMTLRSYPSPARPNVYFKPWKSILGRVLYRERSYGCVRKGSVLFPWGAMGSLWWRLGQPNAHTLHTFASQTTHPACRVVSVSIVQRVGGRMLLFPAGGKKRLEISQLHIHMRTKRGAPPPRWQGAEGIQEDYNLRIQKMRWYTKEKDWYKYIYLYMDVYLCK